jgi:hypothetical protein
MVTRTHVFPAFAMTLAVARAMPFMSPHGRLNNTALFPTSNTTINSIYLHFPALQLAKLENTSCSSTRKGAHVYSEEYAIFNGFFAIMICVAICFPLGVCAISYVTRDRREKDGLHKVAETDLEEKEVGNKSSFPMSNWRRLGKEKVVG